MLKSSARNEHRTCILNTWHIFVSCILISYHVGYIIFPSGRLPLFPAITKCTANHTRTEEMQKVPDSRENPCVPLWLLGSLTHARSGFSIKATRKSDMVITWPSRPIWSLLEYYIDLLILRSHSYTMQINRLIATVVIISLTRNLFVACSK